MIDAIISVYGRGDMSIDYLKSFLEAKEPGITITAYEIPEDEPEWDYGDPDEDYFG
jgi:hypothetical protein